MSYDTLEVLGTAKGTGTRNAHWIWLTSDFMPLTNNNLRRAPYQIDFMLEEKGDVIQIGVGPSDDILAETINAHESTSLAKALPIGRAPFELPINHTEIFHRILVLPPDEKVLRMREREVLGQLSEVDRQAVMRRHAKADLAEMENRFRSTLHPIRDSLPRLTVWGDGKGTAFVEWFANQQHEHQTTGLAIA